jgi:hypothetical protein
MAELFDGTPLDMGCIAFAVLYAVAHAVRQGYESPLLSFRQYCDGMSLCPYLLMSAAVFSTAAMPMLMTQNRMIVSQAGILAAVELLGRAFQRPARRRVTRRGGQSP